MYSLLTFTRIKIDCIILIKKKNHFKFPFFVYFIDGDKDKEDLRRGIIGANDAGGRQKLLRTIRSGKYKNLRHYYIVSHCKVKIVKPDGLCLTFTTHLWIIRAFLFFVLRISFFLKY